MTIIIETPKGSREKFKYELRQEKFVIHKTLPGEMTFPFDFGFVPQTRGEDGDPLDILIISESVYPTGTQLNCRIIGCLSAKQTHNSSTIRNDRFIGIPADSADYAEVISIGQLPEEMISDIQSFFINYLAAENKQVVFLPVIDGQRAEQILQLAKS